MSELTRKSGIDIIGDVRWGTHLCQFYQTKEDLLDILVPYFKAGLQNNEFCMWVTSEPLSAEDVEKTMRKTLPDFDQYLKRGQIEIIPHTEWYLKDGFFNLQRVFNGWIDKLNQVLSKGYDGMRVTGNTAWLEKRDWRDFTDYEEELNRTIGSYKIMVICTYSLDKCSAFEVIDVVSNHQFALIRQEKEWKIIESSERKKTEEEIKQIIESYDRILDNADEAIFKVDSKGGNVLYVNPAGERILGYSKSDWMSDATLGFKIIHPDYKVSQKQIFKKITTDKKPLKDVVLGWIAKDGREVIMEYSIIPIVDKDGQVSHFESIGRDITERRKAREDLVAKNIALREVLEQLEIEKNILQQNVTTNIEKLILPTLKKLKVKGVFPEYIDLLQRNMEGITSSFGVKISGPGLTLSPKEIEICDMIKGGYTNKGIAGFLNSSVQTVEKHRKNIRKKLGIAHKKINLSTYLQHL